MLNYNKKGRINTKRHSPRDLQNKSVSMDGDIVKYLMEQVSSLQEQLREQQSVVYNKSKTDKVYTEEEFNDAVIEAITKETSALVERYEEQINNLKSIIASKDETIRALSSGGTIKNEKVVVDTDRPEIESAVIDPSDNKKLESHITVEGKKQQANMSDKVSKLKKLLG